MRDLRQNPTESGPLKERPNKSQLKREMDALQAIGTKLVDLSPGALAKIPLDDEILEAIQLAKRIRNTREGYRRQLQLIGKLMRTRDSEAITNALNSLKQSGDEENARFHTLEKWRERILIEGDTAIQAFIEENLDADRQKLRQLVRQAQKEAAGDKPPAAYRELFKYLRDVSGS